MQTGPVGPRVQRLYFLLRLPGRTDSAAWFPICGHYHLADADMGLQEASAATGIEFLFYRFLGRDCALYWLGTVLGRLSAIFGSRSNITRKHQALPNAASIQPGGIARSHRFSLLTPSRSKDSLILFDIPEHLCYNSLSPPGAIIRLSDY